MENQESFYGKPQENIEFKAGQRVKEKTDGKEWTILGFANGKVRLLRASEGEVEDLTEKDLADRFVVVSEEHDPLLRELEELVK